MAINVVASASASGSGGASSATTSAIDTTGANLIVIGCDTYDGGSDSTAPTDSYGNTYASIVTQVGNAARVHLYYCASPVVGSGHTFTVPTSAYPAIFVVAVSGAAASPLDGSTGATSAGATVQPGSLTPSASGALLVTVASVLSNGQSLSAIDSGFTIQQSVGQIAGTAAGGALATLIQGVAAAVNPTWSISGSGGGSAAVAVFAASAGGADAGLSPFRHRDSGQRANLRRRSPRIWTKDGLFYAPASHKRAA